MGTITVNVDDETETIFRETVKEEYGLGKGKLGTAFREAMKNWVKIKKEREIIDRQLLLMEEGFHFGKYHFNREELHERTG